MSKTVSRFASAFGLSPVAAAAPKKGATEKEETEEERKSRRAKDRAKKEGESDDDYAKRCSDLDEKEKKEDEAAGRRAETEEDEEDDETEASEEEKDEQCKAAFARGALAGRQAERGRWSRTLASPACTNKGITACTMLANTDMPRSAILSALEYAPEQMATEQPGLAVRMAQSAAAGATPPGPGGAEAPKPGSAAANGAAIVAAADKARGITLAK